MLFLYTYSLIKGKNKGKGAVKRVTVGVAYTEIKQERGGNLANTWQQIMLFPFHWLQILHPCMMMTLMLLCTV